MKKGETGKRGSEGRVTPAGESIMIDISPQDSYDSATQSHDVRIPSQISERGTTNWGSNRGTARLSPDATLSLQAIAERK